MASLDDLKKRIASVKSTQKITKAMKMVAAAKLRRAQESAEKGRPYSEKMNNVILNLSNGISDKENAPKLLSGTGQEKTHLCVVMTSDRGLCGGFNSNIIKNLDVNSHQIKLIKILEEYYKLNYKSFISKILSKKNYKKGFYLYGDVGVGKTMILDFFFNLVEGKKLKLHFNEFMLSFHDFVHQSKGKNDENKISKFVKKLKSKAKLIYFEEFQVTNIVDAMILGKLFDEIFKEDLKIIVTSNIKIENLYKDGLQRDQFKPFIKIMQKQSFEYQLNIDDDYRKSEGNKTQRYYSPLNQENNFKINKLFRVMTKDKVLKEKILNIKGRKFILKNFYDGIVRLTFKEVCDKNLGSEDYIKIVKNCFFIVMENVPAFNDLNSNQQQRFITF